MDVIERKRDWIQTSGKGGAGWVSPGDPFASLTPVVQEVDVDTGTPTWTAYVLVINGKEEARIQGATPEAVQREAELVIRRHERTAEVEAGGKP